MNKLNLNEIIKKGGATLDAELKNINRKNGFMVSILGTEKTFKLNELDELEKNIMIYKNKLNKNEFIGIWLDNNIIYLDISKHYNNKRIALDIALKNKQIAIYDIKNDESIYLKKDVYIVYKYNELKNDVKYIKEYNNLNEIIKDYNITLDSLYCYISNSIDNVKKVFNNDIIFIKESLKGADIYD